MKRILCLLMVLVMTVSLAACGGSGGSGETSNSGGSSGPDGTADFGENAASNSSGNSGQDAGSEQEDVPIPEVFPGQPTIEETVLVDEKDIKITAKSLTYTSYSAELTITIENNSAQDLSFRSSTLAYSCNSINGYMVDGGYLGADVPAGKKSNETLRFDADELLLLGITDIAEIEVGFDISDNSYDTYLQTGPVALKTSLADQYRAADTYRAAVEGGIVAQIYGGSVERFAEEVLYDQMGVRMVSETLLTNPDGEKALLVDLENISDTPVYVSAGNFCFNGLTVQSGTWSTESINPGKHRIMVLILSNMLDDPYWDIFGLADLAGVDFALTLKNTDFDELCEPKEISVVLPGKTASFDSSGEVIYEADGLQVVSKGLAVDGSSYSDDIHILLLLTNGTAEPLSADVAYDSLSANGFMTDFLCYNRTIPAGGNAILDIEMQSRSLEENGVEDLDAIQEVELTLEIRDGRYHTVAEPTMTIQYGE